MLEQHYDYIIKIVLVGNKHTRFHIKGSAGVGKSNILSRFVRNEFNLESKQTVGVEFGPRDVTIESKVIRIQLWDTAGQERFHSITSGFYRNAAGVFLVYDISKSDTFEEISVQQIKLKIIQKKWLKESRSQVGPHTQYFLLGNKSDLLNIREVSKSMAFHFASENRFLYGECSALTGDGVEQCLQKMVSEIYQTLTRQDVQVEYPLDNNKEKRNSITLRNAPKQKSWYCCYLN